MLTLMLTITPTKSSPKTPRTKQSKAASYRANPPAAERLHNAAATPAALAGGTKNSRLVWEQPCNPHWAKGAKPVPPTQPSICLTGPSAARHTLSCTLSSPAVLWLLLSLLSLIQVAFPPGREYKQCRLELPAAAGTRDYWEGMRWDGMGEPGWLCCEGMLGEGRKTGPCCICSLSEPAFGEMPRRGAQTFTLP